MIARLSRSSLSELPAAVRRPAYDVDAIRTGIVHLGVGAFHRAHQAVYVDDRLAAGETEWGIVGASLRSPDVRDQLKPQDGLYSVTVRDGDDVAPRIVGAVRDILVAPEDPARLVEAMADPAVRIVSITVTEKGYCHDPASGSLKEDHPDIVADLRNPTRPVSTPGFVVEALRRRRAAGAAPFTVLSCDNLPANGRTVRGIVARYAEMLEPDLGRFLENEVRFPSTMVDRIVPATTDADRDAVERALGLRDDGAVMTEPFCQWVIEDDFPSGRPRFEEAGAEIVADVEPYEAMKLRLLNGSHSTLAYLGYLAGKETVSDTMQDPAFARLARGLMDEESGPTLHMPPGADLDGYKDALIARFRNPALRHRTWQIAMDGSQKLPQRLLGTARDRLAKGAPIHRIALAVAAWMRYVTGVDEKGQPIDVRDPMAAELRRIADAAGPDARRLAPALLSVREVFGADLPANPHFSGPVTDALVALYRDGASAAVNALSTTGAT